MADLTIGGTSLASLGSGAGLGALGRLLGLGGGSMSGDEASLVNDKESFGASVVSATFDTLNAPGIGQSSMSSTYDFSKSVLSAVYNPTGGITDIFA